MIPISDSIAAHRFPLLNISLIAFTFFVFYLQLTTPDPEGFVYQYALVPAYIDFSNWSTLYPFVTAMFLHGGFLHIISNMLFLWVFGDNVEAHFGWLFFLPVYFLSGIAGNLVQYFVMPGSTVPLIGASGAVAGMLGAYYILLPGARIKTLVPFFGLFTVIEIPAAFMLGYWFVLQLFSAAWALSLSPETGGIAFWAHVGGFITGVVLARITQPEEEESSDG